MFARQAFRSAAPVKSQIRRYATEKPSSGGGRNLGYAAIAGGLGILGYYYYANVLGEARPIPVTQPPTHKAKEAVDSATGTPDKAFKGGDQGFISLKLENIEKINQNTSKFRFALEPNQVSGLPVASALITKKQGEGEEKPTIRPYTPVSDEDAKGYVDFIIKKYKDGPMSEHIHSLQPGQTLEIKGPIPKIQVTENKFQHIAMIAGGTGVTPMWQVARAIFKNPNDKTKVTLVFGNISEEDILLRKEFQELENTYPQRFRAFYLLDNPPPDWQGGKGYVTKELLKTVLPEPKEEGVLIAVCGPPGLYKSISGMKKSPQDQGELEGHLKELGYSKDQVYKF